MSTSPAPDEVPSAPGVSREALKRVERAAGGMATRSVALMDERLPWFRSLPPDQRSWVTLVAQAGIAGYVPWALRAPSDLRLTGLVFGTAPRELLRVVSLRQTVELVRVAIDIAEEHIPAEGRTPAESAALRESLLRYSREIAFSAAAVYAAAAETRGAWDARVEAAVVDGIVRGEDPDTLTSRSAALDWDANRRVAVIAGSTAATGDRTTVVSAVSDWAGRHGLAAMAGIQGSRLVVVLGVVETVPDDVADLFAPGPVVIGPVEPGLAGAVHSAAEALAGLRVTAAWPGAPRPVPSGSLLAERALAADLTAVDRLRTQIFQPMAQAATPLLETLDAYLAHGSSLEPAARSLFVHANTMRYRLHKIAEVTGRDPWNPRDLQILHTASILGRLD